MAMKFTDDQQRVIDLRNCNILVSAAAGSGKTAVLVERIAQMICDSENGTDIDKLLVVTFTNAAAAQMRERITKVLNARVEEEPENQHLQRQLMLIHNAQITTIHSFCLYLIRNHFNDISLDPDFRTADDGERKLLQEEVLEALLEEAFEAADPAFLHCVESFAAGGKEKQLEELVLNLYEYAMSYPWPEQWLKWHRQDYDTKEGITGMGWYQYLSKMVSMLLEEARSIVQESLHICEKPGGPYMYAAALEADRKLLDTLQAAADDPDKMYELLHPLQFARLAAKKDPSVLECCKEQVKKNRERVKGLIGELADRFFYCKMEDWVSDMQKAAPALQTLVDLTLAFKKRLDEKKREKNLLDFHDMEHMALQILIKPGEDGTVVPSSTALEYREHFQEILIDEYQDSNLVQEFLLQSISGEDDGIFNRFMVGDVKQSIYKFRLARPELFLDKFDTYQKTGGNCTRVDLKKNFRSRREVTDCVNDVFLRLMHRELGGVEYDTEAALDPAADYPEPMSADEAVEGVYEPEFLIAKVTADGPDERHQEAMAVAAKIRSLVGKMPVKDEVTGLLRPARYGDIVILLRATSGWDEVFAEELTKAQIPVYTTSKTGYFAAWEVQNVLHFLRVLNNPLQDIPLFGVMHSPFGGFSDSQIASLRALDETGKRKLYDCVKTAASGEDCSELTQLCRRLLDLITRFRNMAVYLPIHNLLEAFLEETGYLYTVTAMPGGQQRRLNLEMLLAKAENFEKTSYSGLFHFVRYMEQLEKYDVDFGAAGALDENADIVRIMSIHKSKGLEFPVCFVSGLSKRFNRQDGTAAVIWDMDLGLACDCIDPIQRTKKTTIKKTVVSRKLRMDSLGEELRVLYVAMTRPQEKLILTAGCKEDKLPAEENGEIDHGSPVSAAHLMEGSSFYDWVLPVWQQCGRKVTVMDDVTEAGLEGGRLTDRYLKQQQLPKKTEDVDLRMPELETLQERLVQRYPHELLEGLFVKTSVSELKMAGMYEETEAAGELFPEEEVIPYLPRFVQEQQKEMGGAARGSAFHRFLELFPFGEKDRMSEWDQDAVAAQIGRMRQSGALKEEYAKAIQPEKILVFLQSDLADRMGRAHKAGLLKREQPFVLGLSASRLKPQLPDNETVLIQGIIDVFFEEEDGLVLADYKTDRVLQASELISRYKVQLDYYEQALTQLTGKPVKERIIYSFALQKEIRL